jgi:hypothetical protein
MGAPGAAKYSFRKKTIFQGFNLLLFFQTFSNKLKRKHPAQDNMIQEILLKEMANTLHQNSSKTFFHDFKKL